MQNQRKTLNVGCHESHKVSDCQTLKNISVPEIRKTEKGCASIVYRIPIKLITVNQR